MKKILYSLFFILFIVSCGSDKTQKKESLPAVLNDGTKLSKSSPTVLFKDYKYGQPKSDFSQSKIYSDCSNEESDVLCKEGLIKFLDNDFSVQLFFNGDKKLDKVGLYAEYNPELFATILGSLPQNKFISILLVDNNSGATTDIIDALKKNNPQKVQDMVVSFINRMDSDEGDNLEIDLIDMTNIDEGVMKKVNNSVDLLAKVPVNSRLCLVGLYTDEEDNSRWIEIMLTSLEIYKKTEVF